MNVDITNHLIPWTLAKWLIREAQREAWDEAFEATCEAHDQWGGLNYTPTNPYAENA